MAVTQMGMVSYDDDGVTFRTIYPTIDDSELDDPRWTTENVDPNRTVTLTKIPLDS